MEGAEDAPCVGGALDTVRPGRAGRLLHDPWEARTAYIDVLLDASDAAREQFLGRHARDSGNANAWNEIRALLEIQRNAMLMYTSCGWFFEDIARIETIQILRYANRALQLAEALSEASLQPEFVRLLGRAPSSDPETKDGATLFRTQIIRIHCITH